MTTSCRTSLILALSASPALAARSLTSASKRSLCEVRSITRSRRPCSYVHVRLLIWHSRQAGVPPVHLVSGGAVSRGAIAHSWPARDGRRRGSLTSFATICTLWSVKLQVPASDHIAYSFGYPFSLGAVIRQRRALLSRNQHAPAVLLQIGY
jgi:hypothetical protein